MPFLDGSEGNMMIDIVLDRCSTALFLNGSEGKGIVEYGLWFSINSIVVWRCDGCILLFTHKYFQTISDER